MRPETLPSGILASSCSGCASAGRASSSPAATRNRFSMMKYTSAMRLLPPTADHNAWRVVSGRSLRAVADGFVSIILPAYLLALGLDPFEVGLVATATLLGSAALTLAAGFVIGRFGHRGPLLAAAA